MKKINIVKESRVFNRIINNEKPFRYKDFIIYVERTDVSLYKFGIAIPKKLGHAVIRNKVKRRIKDIIDKKDYKNDFNCIIIVGKGILSRSFEEMSNNLYEAFDKLNLLKEN